MTLEIIPFMIGQPRTINDGGPMSEAATRMKEIVKALTGLYPSQPQGRNMKRLNILAAMISGIIGSGQSQLPKIAEKIPDKAKPDSVEKRFIRFLKNEHVDMETFFMPYATALLVGLGLEELVLAIDGSVVGRGCVTLMVNVVYKGRALPLAYIVVKGKKGHFPEKRHIELVQKVHEIIPEDHKNVIFLGDGEFDGVELQKTLDDFGWKYVSRTANSVKIYLNDDDEEGCRLYILGKFVAPGYYRFEKDVWFTNEKYGPVMVVVWWGKGNKDPIYLVTNLRLPKKACDYYEKRFRIETFFSDQKSRGFNLHKSHISDPVRLSRLMIASCLAYIWIVFLGVVAVANDWNKKIHRADRCDFSAFQLGLKILNFFLTRELPFPSEFEFVWVMGG